MNTLVQPCVSAHNDFQFNYHSKSLFPKEKNCVYGYELGPGFKELNFLTNGSTPLSDSPPEVEYPIEIPYPTNDSSLIVDELSPSEDSERDHSDAILKFISQVLMEEEDLVDKPCMLRDCLALQATEKSLYDVLNSNCNENAESPSDYSTKTWNTNDDSTKSWDTCSPGSSSDGTDFESLAILSSNMIYPPVNFIQPNDPLVFSPSLSPVWVSDPLNPTLIVPNGFLGHDGEPNRKSDEIVGRSERDHSPNSSSSRDKKTRYREEDTHLIEESRRNKQLANDVGVESDPLEMYDKVLLCPPDSTCAEVEHSQDTRRKELPKVSNRGRPKGGKKQGNRKEVVDLRSLLMQCAQALSSYDSRTVNDLLTQIQKHSTPHGDATERLAHYFANALEARLAGTGTALFGAFTSRRISAAQILKAYQTYINSCPFKKISNLCANRTIKKLAATTTKLHIIDFGILYGFQWPCLIQALSERSDGPPKLRITGIDFPQPGFRPAQRVEETGERLRRYCERFKVPFEYNAIAQKWETIKIEDLKIDEDELLVVNSLNRLHNVPDEMVSVNSPRDIVMDLIKKINPDMFILGSVNGTYNTPFFTTRFKEAVFHFSSLFDMFEATIPREDEDRMLFENEMFGKDIMNIIACEGTERVERPETYKQWQVRNLRSGFTQLPLDQDLVKFVRRKVKRDYHRDFSVDEDGKWILQGWKGRVAHALSYWVPVHKLRISHGN